jgi:alpha-L-rhamnosidase
MKEKLLNNNIIQYDLLCEYSKNPLGIDVNYPRFSWKSKYNKRNKNQKAYQILVSRKKSLLYKNIADMWDSSIVESNCSVNVNYEGKKLKSKEIYFWKVRIWDSEGDVSPYSKISNFELGLLNCKEWRADWITTTIKSVNASPIFRKDFRLDKEVKHARAYISGLGYYELRINGKKVGNNVLDPSWTEYGKRVLYTTYNIDNYINKGNNTVGVLLGTGWWLSVLNCVGKPPQFIMQINIVFNDGEEKNIVTDNKSGWLTCLSPIVFNSIYDGEVYDARLEKEEWDTPGYNIVNDNDWTTPVTIDSPGGIIASQMLEPIEVLKEIKPIKITNPEQGLYVYDLGQNIAGWVKLIVEGPRGTKIILKYSEVLYKNGKVNQENLRSAKAKDIYILKGDDKEIYEPRFTYHGFRYIQVENFPGEPNKNNIIGKVVASSVEKIASFKCSNRLLNKIYKNIIWTLIDNRHSVPTDCPQRDERMGWLNDATTRAEGEIYNFNMARFYTKWLDDISDTQGKETGAIADTAPFVWLNKPADPVCSCYIIIPWLMFLNYGDKRILTNHYEGIKKWVNYLESQSIDNIINFGVFGDWAPPIKEGVKEGNLSELGNNAIASNTPIELVSTGYFYLNTLIISKIAHILKKYDEENIFLEKLEHIKNSFNSKFFNYETNNYGSGNQACNILPLFLDLVPEKHKQSVINNIIKNIIEVEDYHISTGNQCTKYLIENLTDYGYIDLVYKIVTQVSYPSWGYMIKKGASTIWERWEYNTGFGMNSHNHPMNGSISSWFFKGLAGICTEYNTNEGNIFLIKPNIPKGLNYVNSKIKTILGNIVSNWKFENSVLNLSIEIPFNSKAKLYIPKIKDYNPILIFESNKMVWENGNFFPIFKEIEVSKERKYYLVFNIGSGFYNFKIEYKKIDNIEVET